MILNTHNTTTTTVSSGLNNVTIGISNAFNYIPTKSIYNVLGKEIEVEGNHDFYLAISISMINVLGIESYIELNKNNISFPEKIKEYLDKEVALFYRNKTIDTIISIN